MDLFSVAPNYRLTILRVSRPAIAEHEGDWTDDRIQRPRHYDARRA